MRDAVIVVQQAEALLINDFRGDHLVRSLARRYTISGR